MSSDSIDSIVQKAHKSFEAEEFQEAVEGFETAAQRYTEQNDFISAAEMKNNLSVALLKAGKPQLAFEAVLGTDQIFLENGDRKRQAMAYGNIAAALEDLQRYDEAFEYYQRSSDILKELGERQLRAYVLDRISALQVRSGKRLEALVTKESAIDSKNKLSLIDRVLKGLIKTVRKLTGQA